ncbi:MAG TPA: sigma-70 family RNA polymerase sigma factor [Solirubrobacteraceae bacterium]|nr:sigma-70 family RNA polymerase sigma factor [Solirubrobacteraceae bacterium]
MPSPSTVLLRTQSDERLVALARGGHDRAFEAIVERYRRQLLRACRRILPEARAEDALQQALMAAWAALRRGDDVVELRPWLFRIVRNTALNQLRVSGYDLDELVETLSAGAGPEDEVVRRAVVRQTLAAVAALPDRQREALLRTAIEGQAQADVARDLGLSSTAMRQLVHRARVSVRAAATALLPMPAATWLASAGGATATATLAKVGTVAVLAGGAVTAAPTLIQHDRTPARQRAEARADTRRDRPRAVSTPTPTTVPAVRAPVAAAVTRAPITNERAAPDRRGERGDVRSGDGHDGPGSDDHHERRADDDRRSTDDRRSGDDDLRSGDDGHGSRDGDERTHGDDEHDDSGDDGSHSGPGGGDEPDVSGTGEEAELSGDDHHGSGDDEPELSEASSGSDHESHDGD